MQQKFHVFVKKTLRLKKFLQNERKPRLFKGGMLNHSVLANEFSLKRLKYSYTLIRIK